MTPATVRAHRRRVAALRAMLELDDVHITAAVRWTRRHPDEPLETCPYLADRALEIDPEAFEPAQHPDVSGL